MSAVEALKGSGDILKRRGSLTLTQRREALAVNRITQFSKSLSTLNLTTKDYGDAFAIRPQLRRCLSEEILASWDHFADTSTSCLVPKKKAYVPKIDGGSGIKTPEGSPALNKTLRNKRHTIVLESASVVSAGTIDSLIAHLTDVQYITGTQYMEYFLFTYRYFMTADQLLDKLGEVYKAAPSPDLSPEELEIHDKLVPLQRLRVINVLKKWVENHGHDFADVNFLSRFLVFLDKEISEDNQKWTDHLKKIAENRILKSIKEGKASEDIKRWTVKTVKLKDLQSLMTITMIMRRSEIVATRKKNLRSYKHAFHGNEALDWLSSMFNMERNEALNLANQLLRAGFINHYKENSNKEKSFKDKSSLYICNSTTLSETLEEYPKPIRPKTATFSFLDLHPLEVARQLSLIEFKIFEKISPQEFSHQAWSKKNAKEVAPNIMALIERCNEVSYWVATEIVLTPNMKQRVSVLSRFIDIAQICYEFRNWNTLMEIMVGLNLGCVTRLKKTWEALPKHAISTFEQLSRVTGHSQNYLHYREALAAKELPFAPNLAVHLRDLTFIEDGNEDTVEGGLINFAKMHMLGAVFEEIHRLQSTHFHFKEIKAINKYLTQGIYVLKTDKELYKRSNACEPSVRTLSMVNKSKTGRFQTLRSSITKSV